MAFVVYNKETGKQFDTKYPDIESMKAAVLETFGSPDSIPESLGWKEIQTPEELHAQEVEATRKARAEAIPEWQQNLMPYSSREMVETGDSPLMSLSTLKDAFSLPGRLISTAGDKDFTNMSKTSEEYEGFGGRLLTSPVTGATVLAAPFAPIIGGAALKVLPKGVQTAKYALPVATGLIEGLMATGAGAAMDDTYGAGSAAFDIGTSMAGPFAGPLLRAGAQNLTKSSIKQMLIDQGIDATDDVVNDVFNKFYGANNFFKSNKTIGKDMANKNLSMLLSDMEPGTFLSTSHAKPEVIDDIKVSMGSNSSVGTRRTVKEADRDIARTRDFFRKQEMLKEGLDRPGYAGFFEPGEYEQHMADLVSEYSDIPELMDLVASNLSRGRATDKELVDHISSLGKPVPPGKMTLTSRKTGKKVEITGEGARGIIGDKIKKIYTTIEKIRATRGKGVTEKELREVSNIIEEVSGMPLGKNVVGAVVLDWNKALQNIQIGRTMQNKPLRPTGDLSWEHPVVSAAKVAKNVVGSPLVTYPASYAAEGAMMQMPQWLRSIQGDEKPDQGYNLSQLR